MGKNNYLTTLCGCAPLSPCFPFASFTLKGLFIALYRIIKVNFRAYFCENIVCYAYSHAQTKEAFVIPVHVQTLLVTTPPAPSVLVLQPTEAEDPSGNARIIPIWIGINEATQIGIALEKARFARPMTHDLFLDALTNLDACIDHVLVNEMKGATFYSQLVLRQHGQLIQLDARPSDAIALALRQNAPLYVEESVLEKASFPYV
ncbi:MAG: bifunctional nuclease family protein, partial [Raoultibacter sp.]